jgi:hypothetical protein
MPLRPSGSQLETPVYIGDIVQGDRLFFWLNAPLVLVPSVVKESGVKKARWVLSQMNVSRGGTWAARGNGMVASNDTVAQEVRINVGGSVGYRTDYVNRKALAIVGWGAISRAYIQRPRIEGDAPDQTINIKFPRQIPVSFTQ